MPTNPLSQLSFVPEKFIKEVVINAGNYALEHAAQKRSSYKHGDQRDVVTDIDIKVSELVTASIQSVFPTDAIYSEESAYTPGNTHRLWSIDPIDGTSNYTRDLPYYATCLTLLELGVPTLAAIYSPRLNECFTLALGIPYLQEQVIQVSNTQSLKTAAVNFHPGRKPELVAWAGDLQKFLLGHVKKSYNLGSSSLDLCYLACGRTDIVVYGTLSTLDVAGAIALVRAAGGEVYNYDSGEPVDFSTTPQRIIATATPLLLQEFRRTFIAK